MPPTNPLLIGEMAEALLAQARAAILPGANGDPTKNYVTYANPVDDCDNYLLVYVGSIIPFFGPFLSQPRGGGRPDSYGLATQVPFYVRLIRCVTSPKGNAGTVPPDAQQADALRLLEDGWRLWRTLTQEWKAETLFGPAYDIACSNIVLDPLLPIPVSGGVAGWQWKITVQVDEVKASTS